MKVEDIYANLPVLETERTILRKIKELDADDMFQYCSDEEVARYTTWYSHRTIDDTRDFINRILVKYDNKQVAPWGIQDKATGAIIGTCGFVNWNITHSSAELAYALSRRFWNQGYMTEIVNRIIEFGFSEMGLIRIEARCLPDNLGSARVMQKSGMQFEGVMRQQVFAKGAQQDLNMYSIINKQILIREYHPNDLEAVGDLMVDLGYPTEIESLRKRMDRLQSSPMYMTFVAQLNNKVVGMAGVRMLYSYENDDVVTQLSALVTKSEYQSRGIGKALVNYVESWATANGSTVIVLTSGLNEKRLKAHEFYKSIGYEVTGYRFVKRLNKPQS